MDIARELEKGRGICTKVKASEVDEEDLPEGAKSFFGKYIMTEEDRKVLEAIKENEGELGTTIETVSEETGMEEEKVEEVIRGLMEEHEVYEPVEGRFKYLG